jgi:hypothetical protein
LAAALEKSNGVLTLGAPFSVVSPFPLDALVLPAVGVGAVVALPPVVVQPAARAAVARTANRVGIRT